MQVAKWGNSLAMRIPSDVARQLGLKEGDELDIVVTGERTAEVSRKLTREEALERFLARRATLPEGYRFNREELYEDRGPL